jgi:glycosyltransferase involved in cell wall biosynthesis
MSKTIFIISATKIYKGNSAASSRLMNIAKAMALGNNIVYLCSSELNQQVDLGYKKEVESNIFLIGEEKQLNKTNKKFLFNLLYKLFYFFSVVSYIKKINIILNEIQCDRIVYLYPGTSISIEIVSLIILKIFNHNKIFYDFNEIRRAGLYNNTNFNFSLKGFIKTLVFLLNWLKYYFNEKLLVFYDGLIVISTSLENYSRRLNKNLLRVPILSNTNSNILNHTPHYDNSKSFLICFTGLVKIKKEGLELLFEAISRVNKHYCTEIHLFGPILKSEENLILNIFPQKFGIKEKVKYFGLVDQDKLLPEMQKRHLLILPRPLNMQTKYGFSTKLSEYLTSGVPTLVTDVSDNKLYINDTVNGFIVKPGNVEEMVNKILFIIQNYSSLAPVVTRNAFETAKQFFDYSQFSLKLNSFLQ